MINHLFTVEHDGRPEKILYIDIRTGEHLLPPRVTARTVRRYKLVSKDSRGKATYRRVEVETSAWPTDNEVDG